MIEEFYKIFMHLSNDMAWCGILFLSSNATQKAKQILKEGVSKNAHDLVEILPSIPVDDLKLSKDYEYIKERSAELIDRVDQLLKCNAFLKQTTPEEQALMQTAYNDIVQIHNILNKN